jgi:hypothetical protein
MFSFILQVTPAAGIEAFDAACDDGLMDILPKKKLNMGSDCSGANMHKISWENILVLVNRRLEERERQSQQWTHVFQCDVKSNKAALLFQLHNHSDVPTTYDDMNIAQNQSHIGWKFGPHNPRK